MHSPSGGGRIRFFLRRVNPEMDVGCKTRHGRKHDKFDQEMMSSRIDLIVDLPPCLVSQKHGRLIELYQQQVQLPVTPRLHR